MSEIQSYKETNLKETRIGKIPEDWKLARLIDVADYINGYAFSPKDWKTEGLPIIRIQNLNDPDAEFNHFDGQIDNRYFIENGDLLFAWSASIGVYIWSRGEAVLNQHIFKVIPKKEIDRRYFYYALFVATEQLKNRVHGSTMKHFKRGELKATYIPLPSLLEQHKIADILSVVDLAVGKVDEVIAKTERLKKGLMQELLTKGIGHKEFKDTKIGKIPTNWHIAHLGDATDVIMGQSPPGDTYNEKMLGIPLINGPTEFREKYPRKIKWTTSPTKLAKGNDILICVRGHTTGRLNISDDTYCIGRGVAAIRGLERKISSLFLYYIMQRNRNKIFQRSYAAGSTFPNITRKQLSDILIPLPPLEEQHRITNVLNSIDKKLEFEKADKVKLERIKSGLMDLLLSGKVRVKVAD